ncbi:MAG: MBL fold metallo-hydrolase [Gemmatimonadaceae bacterium]|nr:MBL fold metallo-hydrolase [Gemmatimonadaceae bacterium]MBA3777140.1 MBL fold metallo-hydrolase [Betaproteobacteria bacterium]
MTVANGSIPPPERIAQRQVSPGTLACWWLGGSGFVFKSPAGTVLCIDPYLSDSVNGIFGVGRAFPPPISPEDLRADGVISTHWHEDHLDPGTIPVIARVSDATRFIMPPSAMSRALGWGVKRDRIVPLSWGTERQGGQSVTVNDFTITAVPARHDAGITGWEVPDAMGVMIECQGLKIYNSGDTEYDTRLRLLKSHEPDVAMICINGAGGNMNAHEAALLAWQLGARVCVPMHHFLWANLPADPESTLNPEIFSTTYARLGGTGRVVLPDVGGEIDLMTNAKTRMTHK